MNMPNRTMRKSAQIASSGAKARTKVTKSTHAKAMAGVAALGNEDKRKSAMKAKPGAKLLKK